MIISRTSTEIICAHTISVKINSGLFYKPVKLSTYEELEVVWRIMQSTQDLLLPDDSLINLMQVGS
jgi:hypothetical protein